MKKLFAAATALPLLLAAAHAEASGFATARFGGEHGTLLTNNPTALYYNPAGIAESDGFHVFLDANLAIRASSYEHQQAPTDTIEPAGAEGANNGEATLFNVLVAPMAGVTAKFGDLGVGLGFYVPFGGVSIWDKNDKYVGNKYYPGIEDGVQRWYSIEGAIQSYYWTLGVAYEIPDTGLSLGVSGNLIRSRVETIRARETTGGNDILSEGRSNIDVNGWQGSFGVGALYSPLPDQLTFGVSYQARPNVSGGMKLEGVLRNNFAGVSGETPVDLYQDYPDIIRFGVKARPTPEFELRLFGDVTRWSSLDNQCLANAGTECAVVEAPGEENDGAAADGTTPVQNLVRRWNDAFGVRLGGSWYAKPNELELFAGVGYDGSAVPDETLEPALTDFHKISGALGGKLQVIDHLAVALSYTHFFYLSRDTTGKSIAGSLAQPSRSPDSGGKYTSTVGVINVNTDISF